MDGHTELHARQCKNLNSIGVSTQPGVYVVPRMCVQVGGGGCEQYKA